VPEVTGDAVETLSTRIFDRALLRGTFTLRSGQVSDRYLDKYRATCDPDLLGPIAARFAELLREIDPAATHILAPELGAVPLASALGLAAGLPFAIVRGTAKGYGTANRLEGIWAPAARAVLVEDVVTTGGAALDALEVGRTAGLIIERTLCVLDRDCGGAEALAAAGAPLTSILDADDLNAAFDAGLGVQA